jgi:hypothetical protein
MYFPDNVAGLMALSERVQRFVLRWAHRHGLVPAFPDRPSGGRQTRDLTRVLPGREQARPGGNIPVTPSSPYAKSRSVMPSATPASRKAN